MEIFINETVVAGEIGRVKGRRSLANVVRNQKNICIVLNALILHYIACKDEEQVVRNVKNIYFKISVVHLNLSSQLALKSRL
jgi:hypothetical protein